MPTKVMPTSRHDLRFAVGSTPLVELKSINVNPRVQILAKLEGNNPGGSAAAPSWSSCRTGETGI